MEIVLIIAVMKKYSFNKQNINLLTELIFDSSIEIPVSFDPKILNRNISFKIERRILEDVRRKKILFFNKTIIKGSLSSLTIYPVYNIKNNISNNVLNSDNDFIHEIIYDQDSKILIINTIRIVNAIELHVDDAFIIVLEDIMESNFGKGICFGKVGYTIDEWNKKYYDSIHINNR